MEEVVEFFKETQEGFLVYVVEQRFVIGRGKDYFKSYRGKPNYFDSQAKLESRIDKCLKWIQKNIPAISNLLSAGLKIYNTKSIDIQEIITTFTKITATGQHDAAEPDIIDPIIIQEGDIQKKTLAELITLYESSSIKPSIIILLKDNDFERAKSLLSDCPHGLIIKMIRNSGESIIYRVINSGSPNADEFIDSFSKQLFSSCSKTPRDVIYGADLKNQSFIEKFTPLLLKVRSNLLLDYKFEIQDDIDLLIRDISKEHLCNKDDKLMKSFLCMVNLFKVYCYDSGNTEISQSYSLAKDIGNDLLLAHVYRYSNFFPNKCSRDKQLMLKEAEMIFKNNNVYDHAIYCKNNYNVNQFFTDIVYVDDFKKNMTNAIHNVPGLAGMSHIYNNLGIAFLFNAQPQEAIKAFQNGIDYCINRPTQRIGLEINTLIAKDYYGEKISDTEICFIVKSIFDSSLAKRLPFIASNYLLNCISLSLKHYNDLAIELLKSYPIQYTIDNAFKTSNLGSNLVSNHIKMLHEHYNFYNLLNNVTGNDSILSSQGKKQTFIQNELLNPIIFFTWL